jgi:hypothetical protein
MGNFNVSCVLSGLAIRADDPCYYIPLKQTFRGSSIPISSFICSNETINVFFEPATLPILGKYNDYGKIDIIEDSNTKSIERFLGISIKDLFKYEIKMKFSDDFFRHKEEKEFKLAGCFIHKFAYDIAVKHMLQRTNYGDSYYTHFPVNNKLLEAIGLDSPIDAEEIDKRYRYMYKVKGEENYVISSDGDFSCISKLSNGVFQGNYLIRNLRHLSEQWLKYTGKKIDIPEDLKTKNVFRIKLDEYRDSLNKLNKEIEDLKKEEKESDCEIKKLIAEMAFENISKNTTFAFNSFYAPEILSKDENIYRLFEELSSLSNFMYLNSKIFMPNTLSPQGGDYNAELDLLKASKDYIEQKIKIEEDD